MGKVKKAETTATTQDFIEKIRSPDDIICLRLFDDKKTGKLPPKEYSFRVNEYGKYADELQKLNEQGYGVFFVVNGGGTKDDEISKIFAQFMENDDMDFEEQWEMINAFPLKPSFVVQTRKSLHTYWLVKDAEVEKFRPVQKQLIAHFKSDKSIVNESRVMRLPGFYHNKKEPVMVTCRSFHPEYCYTQDELSAVLPAIEGTAVKTVNTRKRIIQGDEQGLTIAVEKCCFLQHCRDDAESLPEHDWYAMITNLAPFTGGYDAIHQFSSPYPEYNENATDEKIKHFLDSKTGPMTCREIFDKGYTCPKFENGECDCTAPAALAYKALTIEELKERLFKCEKSDSFKNAETASNFIATYLYNLKPTLAESFIESEMQPYFNITGTCKRNLIKEYKYAREQYVQKFDEDEDRLPEWYIRNNNGIKFLPGVLADYMTRNADAFYCNKSVYRYYGGVYSEITKEAAYNSVRERMIPELTKYSEITDSANQWFLQIEKGINELNVNQYIINCTNGLYYVLENRLDSHTPQYFSTIQLPINYDENAKCPRFEQFIKETFNEEQGNLVQEILGYTLIPVSSAQKAIIFVGEGRAGKSLLLRVITEVLLGRKNVSNVAWQSLNERFKTAELFGKLANICADLPSKNIDDNGMFKALTGEDFVSAERKNKDPFSFQNKARLLFSCNTIPKNLGDKSNGFYRRLVIVRFTHSVPEDKVDPNLIDKFKNEADGIFLYALEGLRRLVKQGFHFSETEENKRELEKYRIESNSVLAFAEERCEFAPKACISTNALFTQYKNFCLEGNYHPVSQQTFNKDFMSNFKVKKSKDTHTRRYIFVGVDVTKD